MTKIYAIAVMMSKQERAMKALQFEDLPFPETIHAISP